MTVRVFLAGELGQGARIDPGFGEHCGVDADLAPRPIRDPVMSAVRGGQSDKRGLHPSHVDGGGVPAACGPQIEAFLHPSDAITCAGHEWMIVEVDTTMILFECCKCGTMSPLPLSGLV